MGEPGCWRRPPPRTERVSPDANPMSWISFATDDFAAASSPAMNTTSRPSYAGREPLARVFHPIVLKAFTSRAPGRRFATSSLDVLSPRSMTRPTAEYGFIASITILPAKRPTAGSWSILRYGRARSTASPNLTSSSDVAAFAFEPIEATSGANDAGPRELLTATGCPARANDFGGVGFGYLFVFIGAYLPQIGVGAEVVGLLFGAQGVSMVLSAIPLGIYSDRRGRKGLLLIASVILPPSVLVFAFTTDLRWLVPAAVVAGIGEGAFLSTWNAIIADQTTVEQRSAAFSLSFILNNVAGGAGFALPLAFPALQAATGIDSHTIHIGALVVTDAIGFLMPIAFYLLLRGYRESVRPRDVRPKTMDWRPLLKFSGINGLIRLRAGFFIPLLATWMLLKFAVQDTSHGPLLALANVTIGIAAIG